MWLCTRCSLFPTRQRHVSPATSPLLFLTSQTISPLSSLTLQSKLSFISLTPHSRPRCLTVQVFRGWSSSPTGSRLSHRRSTAASPTLDSQSSAYPALDAISPVVSSAMCPVPSLASTISIHTAISCTATPHRYASPWLFQPWFAFGWNLRRRHQHHQNHLCPLLVLFLLCPQPGLVPVPVYDERKKGILEGPHESHRQHRFARNDDGNASRIPRCSTCRQNFGPAYSDPSITASGSELPCYV